ncbi:O-antigen ligase family protein [Chryseobacterium glaciei]|nr:O-antigen ligase family protein [Chryseobacterium glaciei]
MKVPINKGANANYFVSLIPFALGIWSRSRNYQHKQVIKIFCFLLQLLCIVIVFKSNARLAYVCLTLSLGFYFYQVVLSVQHKLKVNKTFLWIVTAIFLIVMMYSLYHINTASVQGRFLIYTISLDIFKQNPFFGCGLGRFESVYNLYQAEYFRTHVTSVATQFLAGDTFEPFNELLRILIELGLCGVLFFILIVRIFYLFLKKQEHLSVLQYGALGSLLSISISALLSYPFSLLSIQLNAIFFLSVLTANERQMSVTFLSRSSSKFTLMFFFFIATVLSVGFAYRKIRSCLYWEKASLLALEGNFSEADKLYFKAWPSMQYNGRFLTNYGSEMVIAGKTKQGVECLERASKFLPSTGLYLCLGEGYAAIGNYGRAQIAYETALHMTPSRFMSRYRLLKLQLAKHNIVEAKKIAEQILAYPVKIPSSDVTEIKQFSKKLLVSENNTGH